MQGQLGGLRLRSRTAPKPMGQINHTANYWVGIKNRNSGLLGRSGTLNGNL